ncbi:M23/M56 family metallopeptidase [Pseudoalteromonas sp. Of7M-16]|uniref:M23/M56 family metallopeptidase n=1 Tax=Pseudoalteromonas sp. Of7M-16 TaxID=2917756 RepID=UPI001EF619B9|nr:M23/M56 family metallopeptidase [Pseudoalteromonas sp. Of7M-16]MCG7551229.1 M23/M56 family metallopeptidase [Pseudoalteromonas sp. Of7M-16]
MDWTLVSPVMVLALWLFTSYLLLNVGNLIARRYPSSPTIWWAVLALSALPILPIGSSSELVHIPKVLLEFGSYIEQKQHQVPRTSEQSTLFLADVLLYGVIALYLAVAVYRLYTLFASWQNINRLLSTSEPFKQSVTSVPCVQLPINCSPFVFGIANCKIVLPNYFSNLDSEQQYSLLCHEVTHIRSKDHLALIAWSLLGCIFWFNPFIKRMEKCFVHALELRCDQFTVTHFELNKKHYAATLVTALKHSVNTHSFASAANFSSGALSLADYKLRLQEIIEPKSNKPAYLIILLSLITALLGFVNLKAAPAIHVNTSHWHNPLDTFWVSSHYGHISEFRNSKAHGGIDLVAPVGAPVMAVSSGTVVIADATTLSSRYGNVVLVQHENGYQSLYAHLDTIVVEPGTRIKGGGKVGTLGATGRVTGPHLHFELLYQEQRINPLAILALE